MPVEQRSVSVKHLYCVYRGCLRKFVEQGYMCRSTEHGYMCWWICVYRLGVRLDRVGHR